MNMKGNLLILSKNLVGEKNDRKMTNLIIRRISLSDADEVLQQRNLSVESNFIYPIFVSFCPA